VGEWDLEVEAKVEVEIVVGEKRGNSYWK
jgi:hypothetical protein